MNNDFFTNAGYKCGKLIFKMKNSFDQQETFRIKAICSGFTICLSTVLISAMFHTAKVPAIVSEAKAIPQSHIETQTHKLELPPSYYEQVEQKQEVPVETEISHPATRFTIIGDKVVEVPFEPIHINTVDELHYTVWKAIAKPACIEAGKNKISKELNEYSCECVSSGVIETMKDQNIDPLDLDHNQNKIKEIIEVKKSFCTYSTIVKYNLNN